MTLTLTRWYCILFTIQQPYPLKFVTFHNVHGTGSNTFHQIFPLQILHVLILQAESKVPLLHHNSSLSCRMFIVIFLPPPPPVSPFCPHRLITPHPRGTPSVCHAPIRQGPISALLEMSFRVEKMEFACERHGAAGSLQKINK